MNAMHYTDSNRVARAIVAIAATDMGKGVVVGAPLDADTHDQAALVPVAYIVPSGTLGTWWLIDRTRLGHVEAGTIPPVPAPKVPPDPKGDRFDVGRTWAGRDVIITVVVTSWGYPGSFENPPEGPEAECIAVRYADTAEALPAMPADRELAGAWERMLEEAIDEAVSKGPPDVVD